MEQENEIRTLPDLPPRHCPTCGARVADRATTCLMCGAILGEAQDQAEETITQQVTHRRLTGRQIALLAGLAIFILVPAIWLGMNLSGGQALPTFTPTTTLSPTVTSTPTLTPTPSPTPPPTLTPTPVPPQLYTVQAGDTLGNIAANFGLTVAEIRAYNNLDSELIREGDTLQIPPPTPTPGPTPTLDPSQPTPTLAPFVTYVVQRGDTLSTIAEQYGVSMAAIRDASGLETGVTAIQEGQVLQIPQFTPTPVVAPEIVTEDVTSSSQTFYAPPILLYPPDNTTLTETTGPLVLQWASSGLLPEDSFYRVALTVPNNGDTETLYTVLRATTWRAPNTLFPTGGETATYRWTVEIVRRIGEATDPRYEVVSSAEEIRSFSWSTTQP